MDFKNVKNAVIRDGEAIYILDDCEIVYDIKLTYSADTYKESTKDKLCNKVVFATPHIVGKIRSEIDKVVLPLITQIASDKIHEIVRQAEHGFKTKWRPEIGGRYWSISMENGKAVPKYSWWACDEIDVERDKNNNVFETQELAQIKANKINEMMQSNE